MNSGASTSVIVASSLIRTCSDGPAVSLNGSPTVSPTTAAACASLPLPSTLPSSSFRPAGFDELLGVVPGAAAVVEHDRQQDAGDRADHQHAGRAPPSAGSRPTTIGTDDRQSARQRSSRAARAHRDVDAAARSPGVDVPAMMPGIRRGTGGALPRSSPCAARPTARMASEVKRKTSAAPISPPTKTCGLAQVDRPGVCRASPPKRLHLVR